MIIYLNIFLIFVKIKHNHVSYYYFRERNTRNSRVSMHVKATESTLEVHALNVAFNQEIE